MNRSFLPLFSKQREQREMITQQTKQITTLVTQLHAAQTQLGHVQENLKNCIVFWQEIAQPEMDTLRGKVADRDEKITDLEKQLKAAKYHGKKKPESNTVVAQ